MSEYRPVIGPWIYYGAAEYNDWVANVPPRRLLRLCYIYLTYKYALVGILR